MAKLIKILTPLEDGSTKWVSGRTIILPVGDKKIKFFIQQPDMPSVQVADLLLHRDSGRVVGRMKYLHVRYAKHGRRLSDREAASIVVRQLVDKAGAEEILRRLNSVEKIN